jgi:hypothetical protein
MRSAFVAMCSGTATIAEHGVSHPVPLPPLPRGIERVLRPGDLTEPHLEVDPAAHAIVRREGQIVYPARSFDGADDSKRIHIEEEDPTPARRNPRVAWIA